MISLLKEVVDQAAARAPVALIGGLLPPVSANCVVITAIQGVCAFLLLLFPWWSYQYWRQTGDPGLPLFSAVSAMYWVYFVISFSLSLLVKRLQAKIAVIR